MVNKFCYTCFVVVLLALSGCARDAVQSQFSMDEFYGEWIITSVYPSTGIGVYGRDDSSLLHSIVLLSPHKIVVKGVFCEGLTYKLIMYDNDIFYKDGDLRWVDFNPQQDGWVVVNTVCLLIKKVFVNKLCMV